MEEISELWDRHPELHDLLLQLLRDYEPDPAANPEPLHTDG